MFSARHLPRSGLGRIDPVGNPTRQTLAPLGWAVAKGTLFLTMSFASPWLGDLCFRHTPYPVAAMLVSIFVAAILAGLSLWFYCKAVRNLWAIVKATVTRV
jgi:hypothetical protein